MNRPTSWRGSFLFWTLFAFCLVCRQACLEAATCSKVGAQNTLIIVIKYPFNPPDPPNFSTQSIRNVFFSSAAPSLNNYWQEASYGKTWATGDVVYVMMSDTGPVADCGALALETLKQTA